MKFTTVNKKVGCRYMMKLQNSNKSVEFVSTETFDIFPIDLLSKLFSRNQFSKRFYFWIHQIIHNFLVQPHYFFCYHATACDRLQECKYDFIIHIKFPSMIEVLSLAESDVVFCCDHVLAMSLQREVYLRYFQFCV